MKRRKTWDWMCWMLTGCALLNLGIGIWTLSRGEWFCALSFAVFLFMLWRIRAQLIFNVEMQDRHDQWEARIQKLIQQRYR